MAQSTKTPENLPALHTGGKVAAIVPTSFNEAVQIAGAIVRAGMAPRGYDSTEKATVAILAGLEVGFTPFAALQSIAVINGTPAIYGDGLVALVRASGLLEDMQEGLDVNEKGEPQAAWCKVKRKGEPSWKERMLTRPECARAGWLNKQGPWTATPGRMMTIRVRGWLFRDVFADVLRGLKSAEEVEDMVDVTPAKPAAPEPQRADYENKEPTLGASPHSDPGEGGQAVSEAQSPAAGGETVASGQSAKPVTDVEDLSEGEQPEPLEFEMFETARAFFEFSDAWLEDPKRTPAEARQWEEFYRVKIKEMAEHKFERIREAITMTIQLYSAVLARETKG